MRVALLRIYNYCRDADLSARLNSVYSELKNIHLIKNSLWNIIGQTIPLASALVTIPILIKTIGEERFGFLTIAWMLIGYFSLFDFGIGRAITFAVSQRLDEGQEELIDILWTAFIFLFGVSIIVSLGIFTASTYIINELINLSSGLRVEAVKALKILSLSIPFVILSSGLRGALEGKQAFRAINLCMIPFGMLLFIAPAVVSQFSISLEYVIASLLVVRCLAFTSLFVLCKKNFEYFLQWKFNASALKKLLHFGGWMTVSNIASPIMVNMDRVFIGSQLSVAAVTYYVVPFDIISKALMLPSAIAGAMFPEFARLSAQGQRKKVKAYLLKSLASVFALLALPLSLVFFFAHPLLELWISGDIAVKSSAILKVLCIGILINGLAYIPFAFIQGMGRSDITAKFHLVELIIYLPMLIYFIQMFGLIGVAYAWILRVLIDLVLLSSYCHMELR